MSEPVHALRTPGRDIDPAGATAIANALRLLLADVFALYVKTKSSHWHIGGRHFRDYHLLLDEQANQLAAMTDAIAERARKLGRTTVQGVGEIARLQRIKDSDVAGRSAIEMLQQLREDNVAATRSLADAHELCDQHGDIATASLIENWMDEAEGRIWFLTETLREDQ